MTMVSQLRIYVINKGQMDAFVKAWREQVVPLRQKHGFKVEGGWVVEGESRFVWIVSAEQEEWMAKESGYYNSPERKAMSPDPASFIAHMEIRMMNSVPTE